MMIRRALVFSLFFATTAMAAPGGFTITVSQVCTNTTPSLKIDWTPSSGATSYSVIRDGSPIASTTGLSYDDTAVTSGDSHTYSVIASDGSGTTPSANSLTRTAPYCTAPDRPELTLTLICQSASAAVRLDWTAAARAETYDVFRNGIRIRTDLSADTLSIVDTNVTAGTLYSYFVRAKNLGTLTPTPPPTTPSDSDTQSVTVTNPCPPPPASPAVSTSASCSGSGNLAVPKVSVSWSASPGATHYTVYRDDVFQVSTTGTTHEDTTNVSAGNTYTYKVYAQGEGGQSAPGTSTIMVPANICSPPPDAPVLQATNICTPSDTAAVHLTWNAANNATSYMLFRNSFSIASGLTSTQYQDTPTLGGTHTYVVRAVNGSGTADSSPVTITHTDVCPRPPGAFSSSVSVVCLDNEAAVRVTWTSSSNATSYSVLRNGSTIGSGLTGNSYDDTSVTDGATYSYVVRASNNVGSTDTAASGVTVVDPCPRPPGNSTLTGHSFCAGTSPAVYLSWTAAERAMSYSVLRNGTAIATGLTDTTYEDTTVTAGTQYTYAIRALNANGSTDSNPFVVTPESCNVATPRPDLTVSNVTLSKSSAAPGDTIDVTYTLTNNGTGDAAETQTRIRLGDELVVSTASPPLTAGNSRTETHQFIVPSVPGGAYTVSVSANDDRAVDETTFTNNTGSANLEIADTQCIVSCLVAAPARAIVGQAVRFSLLVPPSCDATVTWQFGNGTSLGGESALVSYTTAGTYNWTVVITSGGETSCANAGTIEVTAMTKRRAARH